MHKLPAVMLQMMMPEQANLLLQVWQYDFQVKKLMSTGKGAHKSG